MPTPERIEKVRGVLARRQADLRVVLENVTLAHNASAVMRTCDAAGVLKLDDIIISLAGQPTPTSASLVAAIAACRPGQTVRIEVIREGRTVALEQILGATSP